jgi:cysteinyl-tRNA synthetase
MTQDIMRRILRDYFGYEVNFVMNITDVDDKVSPSYRGKGNRSSSRSPDHPTTSLPTSPVPPSRRLHCRIRKRHGRLISTNLSATLCRLPPPRLRSTMPSSRGLK